MTTQRKHPIYLDYSATTPVDPRVAEKMIPWLTEHFGNPASRSHGYGWEAEEAVENARAEVAKLVNADPKEIIWTSGATESDNLALKGAAHFYKTKGKHLITMKTEHKAVLDTMRELEREGFEVTYLDPEPNGLLDLDKFKAALRPDTIVVSIMLVNNEIGVIQPIAEIGEITRAKGIIFHVDAAQATGKVAIDLEKGPRASARSTCVASRGCAWKRRCTAAATRRDFARARSPRTRSSAWEKRSGSRALKWPPRTNASACSATSCSPASRTWKRST